MTRRWRVGQKANPQPRVYLKAEPGQKEGDDIVFELMTSGWVKVSMATVACIFEALVENEQQLAAFRPHWKQTAVEKLTGLLNVAVEHGWEAARDQLEAERRGAAATRTAAQPTTVRVVTEDFEEGWLDPAQAFR